MSAFICNPHHIGRLAGAFEWLNNEYSRGYRPEAVKEYCANTAAQLCNWNVRSIAARYPDTKGAEAANFLGNIDSNEQYVEEAAEAAYQYFQGFILQSPTKKVMAELIQMATCLEYQSCEHAESEQDTGHKINAVIMRRFAKKLADLVTGDDGKVWEWHPSDDKPGPDLVEIRLGM